MYNIMSDITANCRVLINTPDAETLSLFLNLLPERVKDRIVHKTEIRENTREPFEGGKHQIIYFALGAHLNE